MERLNQRNLHRFLEKCHNRAELHSNASTNFTPSAVDTWEPLPIVLVDGDTQFFDQDGSELTFMGKCETALLFTGTANVNGSAQESTLTFGLFQNGVVVDGCITPVSFGAQSRTKAFACSQILKVRPGDVITLKYKGTSTSITYTATTMSIAFWGR